MVQQGDQWLAGACVDPSVFALRPDYRALLVLADGLVPGPSDGLTEKMLRAAEDGAPADHPHVDAWREAFRAFGAKPQRTRPSVDALLRRVPQGLPRVDRLTDAYNAVSVRHAVPIGGEDVDRYRGPLRLVRATGDEPFDTRRTFFDLPSPSAVAEGEGGGQAPRDSGRKKFVAGGQPAVEHPTPGEVVWRDDEGVTCRRWNWRQCVRTRLGPTTTRAVFILDALGPLSDPALVEAGSALVDALRATSPGVEIESRTLQPGT